MNTPPNSRNDHSRININININNNNNSSDIDINDYNDNSDIDINDDNDNGYDGYDGEMEELDSYHNRVEPSGSTLFFLNFVIPFLIPKDKGQFFLREYIFVLL